MIGPLKRQARDAYRRYMDEFDRLDCGHHMAQHASRYLREQALLFDTAMDALAKLEPDVPEFRLAAERSSTRG